MAFEAGESWWYFKLKNDGWVNHIYYTATLTQCHVRPALFPHESPHKDFGHNIGYNLIAVFMFTSMAIGEWEKKQAEWNGIEMHLNFHILYYLQNINQH